MWLSPRAEDDIIWPRPTASMLLSHCPEMEPSRERARQLHMRFFLKACVTCSNAGRILKGVGINEKLDHTEKGPADGSAALTASALSANFAKQVLAEIIPAQPGIQLYSVGKELQADVPGTLHALRAMGYIEVETAGFAGVTAKQFRQAFDQAGVKCSSAHFFDYTNPDPGPFFEEANTLGVHYVVTSVINDLIKAPPGQLPTIDNYKAMADYINHLGTRQRPRACSLPITITIPSLKTWEAARWVTMPCCSRPIQAS